MSQGQHSTLPPSVLPDISPSRGEIGFHFGLRQSPTLRCESRQSGRPISPLEGRGIAYQYFDTCQGGLVGFLRWLPIREEALMSFLLSIFREVRDPRDINARHDLGELLFLALAATLCGAKSCVEIAEFVEGREEELREIVSLEHGCPSHDTFSRIFRLVDPAQLSSALEAFLAALRKGLGLGLRPKGVVAVDGKALRRGYKKGRVFMPPLMVSVWDAE